MTRKKRPVCVIPGCDCALHKDNSWGLCKIHLHVRPYCKCPKCLGEGVARRVAPIDRPNVRRVSVAYATGNSAIDGRALVSLPREPWLQVSA